MYKRLSWATFHLDIDVILSVIDVFAQLVREESLK